MLPGWPLPVVYLDASPVRSVLFGFSQRGKALAALSWPDKEIRRIRRTILQLKCFCAGSGSLFLIFDSASAH